MSSIATEPNGSQFPAASCQPQGRFSYLRLRRNLKPIDSGWGSGGAIEHQRLDMPTIRQHAASGRSLAVRTGRQSSCFVVDVDPRHGGDESLAALIAEHGDLPETYTVRTGGGGWHYYFRLPAFEVHSNNTGLVGAGIDIKGEGSYVVAAGSVKPDGSPYVALDPDAKIAPAPEWLLAILRGRTEHVAERRSAALEEVEKVPVPGECCEALVARAVRSIEAKMDKLAKAPEGKTVRLPGGKEVGWDEGYFLLAARLIEIARWPFASFTMADAERVFSAHVPDSEDGFDPDHKWEQGLTEARTWLKGNTHRVNDHVGVLDKVTGQPMEPAAVAALAAASVAAGTEPQSTEEESVLLWAKADLSAALNRARDGYRITATVGLRSDGKGCLYPGRFNLIFGESESGKSMVAFAWALERLRLGETAVVIDYEDSDDGLLQRLADLGASWEEVESWVEADTLRYVNPDGEPTDADLDALCAGASYVVIDATTESVTSFGLNDNAAVDIAAWQRVLPKKIAKRFGATVLTIDHTPHGWENKDRPTGSQHKKSGVDGVQLKVENVLPFVIGKGGRSRIVVSKDRHAAVRGVSAKTGPRKFVFGEFAMIPDSQKAATLDDAPIYNFTIEPAAETEELEKTEADKVLEAERELVFKILSSVQQKAPARASAREVLRSMNHAKIAVDKNKVTAGLLTDMVKAGFLNADFSFKAYPREGWMGFADEAIATSAEEAE